VRGKKSGLSKKRKMLKKGQLNTTFVVIALIIAAIFLVPAFKEAVIGFLGGSTQQPGPGPQPGQGGVCPPGVVIEDTTVTVSATDVYSPSTPVGSQYYWLNGQKQGYLVSGGSFQASPGDKVKILFAENSTTYYGLEKEYTVPCQGTYSISEELFPMSTSEDWSVTLINDDGTSNTLANQTISAGLPKTVTVKLESAWNKAIGSPYIPGDNNVLSCRYNTTAYDSIDLTDDAGNSIPTTSIPVFLPTQTLSKITWKSWKLPQLWSGQTTANGLAQTNSWTGKLRLDPDDTYDPDGTAGSWDPAGDIECRLDDVDYDLHQVTYDIIHGVEDEDNNNLGVTSFVFNYTIEVN